MKTYIKFENQKLNELRGMLLKDLDKEYFAILLGKMNKLDDVCIITVKDIIPYKSRYEEQSVVSISVSSDFRAYCLEEVTNRVDVDTIIDVHTHPFSEGIPHFSSVDTGDEVEMKKYLIRKKVDVNYASIVFSRDMYSARLWECDKGKVYYKNAIIKTQKISESIKASYDNLKSIKDEQKQLEMFNRSLLALGNDTLKSMMRGQVVSIVGVGGVGSIIGENLIHMGFQEINLIDFDEVEISNLNRLVGVTYQDAIDKNKKVDCIKRHLEGINPSANINAYCNSVYDREIEKVLAMSDWIFMTTDNYSSCVHIQDLAFKYYVPFISAATNIVVEDGNVTDMRGEVILVRIGDGFCMNCLGKIDKNELMFERVGDPQIREQLVQKNYVRGLDVKDPAVKTLNSMVATIATDVLINQYTERQMDQFVIVYENNEEGPVIYEDVKCVKHRDLSCGFCGGVNG